MSERLPSLETLLSAMKDPAYSPQVALAGTKWSDDPRLEAWRKAEHDVGDLLWEAHLEVEERTGVLCAECSRAAREEATRP